MCTCLVSGQQQLEAIGKVVVGEARGVAGSSDASDLQDPAAAQLVQDHWRLEQPGNCRLVGLDAPYEMQLRPAAYTALVTGCLLVNSTNHLLKRQQPNPEPLRW